LRTGDERFGNSSSISPREPIKSSQFFAGYHRSGKHDAMRCTGWHSRNTEFVWHDGNSEAIRITGLIRFPVRKLSARVDQRRAVFAGVGLAIPLRKFTGYQSAELAIRSQRFQLQSGITGHDEFAQQQESPELKFSEQPEFTEPEFDESKFPELKFPELDFPEFKFTKFWFPEPEFTEHDFA
jgi:hypothetical protein